MADRRVVLWKAATPMSWDWKLGLTKAPRVAAEGVAAHREARAVCRSRDGRIIEAIVTMRERRSIGGYSRA